LLLRHALQMVSLCLRRPRSSPTGCRSTGWTRRS
jgi:hypothetical protein